MSDLLVRCSMCGHLLAVLTLCDGCGERFCPVVCWKRHVEERARKAAGG